MQFGERRAVASLTAMACVRGETTTLKELSRAKERPAVHWNKEWVPKGKDPTQASLQLMHEACRDFCSREQLNERTGAGVTQGARDHPKLAAPMWCWLQRREGCKNEGAVVCSSMVLESH